MLRVVLCVLCLCALCVESRSAELPREMEDLLGRARSAPPEFAADALIRIAESGRIPDRAMRLDLLEEAFRVAAGAQQPVRQVIVDTVGDEELREEYLHRAFELGLDALSLRLRAVEALLRLEPPRARHLFAELGPLRARPRACADAFLDHVDYYYKVAGIISARAFTAEEREKQAHIDFAESLIAGVESPSQLVPAAKLLEELPFSTAQFERLLGTYTNALGNISGDDRSFTFFMAPQWTDRNAQGIPAHVEKLALAARERNLPVGALLRAYRDFLVRHLTAVRCVPKDESSSPALPGVIAMRFTSLLRRDADASTAGITPLMPNELQPRRVEGSARQHLLWKSPVAKKLYDHIEVLAELFAGKTENPVEFSARFQEALSTFENWKVSDEPTEHDYWLQKSELYRLAFLALGKYPELRRQMLNAYIRFIEGSNLQYESRIEWFAQVRFLLDLRSEKDEAPYVAEALKNSQHAVLLLYRDLGLVIGD